MGGEKMRAAGLEGVDSTPLSVVGIVEVLEKFPKIRKAFARLKTLLDRESFDCVVLIDYPDFNLRLAKEAKKRGIPVIYYISPQVWAWRKKR
jgi:lipid-A-disaccharide synthase